VVIKEKNGNVAPQNKFSTFSGVFVPSVLAILGAVMYYIAPKVVGGVGLLQMFGIILLAHSITIATAFSISSIATNIQVKGGGLYYLISRSLGREFGGSIGIQLFLAQTVASSFYVIAFSQAVSAVLVSIGITVPLLYITLVSCTIFGIIVYKGAHFVIKIQYFILAAILLSLVSIFLGPQSVAATDAAKQTVNLIPFWVAFAMFFPAVTGIDAGVGMSGELKDPKKSLVKGTFFSILFTMVIYFALAIKVSLSASSAELVSNPTIIHNIALVPWLVIVGVLLATTSSALSCFMTAPRSLRAMVKDKMFHPKLNFLAESIGKSNEPRIALIVSFIIAMAILFMGGLDFVAKVVAMLFLNVYGWINGAAFFEKISYNPSYRPSFNSPSIIHLYGMIACYAVMYLFNPWIMIVGILFQIVMFYFFLKTRRSANIEGVWEGVLFQLLRKVLKKIAETEQTRKNWRPTMIGFCANGNNKMIMANILDWINSNRSITKMYFLVPGRLRHNVEHREDLEEEMKVFFKEKKFNIFPRVVVSNGFRGFIKNVVQSETIGGLSFNTMFFDFDENFKIKDIVTDALNMKKNVIILRNNSGFSEFKTIDVWWNSSKKGNFLTLLAYLISHSKKWEEDYSTIRVFKIIKNKKDYENERSKLAYVINQSRIENVEFQIIVNKKDSAKDIMHKNSKDTDLVIMGIPDTCEGKVCTDLTARIKDYTDKLRVTLICSVNDEIDIKVN
jgi:amino acid transporter